MSTLLFIQASVPDDPEIRRRYRDYQARVMPLIASHGGRLLATGQQLEAFEGDPPNRRVIVLEFPNSDALRAFWTSEDYAEVRRLREGCTVTAWALPSINRAPTG